MRWDGPEDEGSDLWPQKERTFGPGDHRATHEFFKPENRRRVLDALETVRPIAERHKVSLTQLMINWTIHQPGITAALVGARNAEQARHNAAAMDFTLSEAERGKIRAAFDGVSGKLDGGNRSENCEADARAMRSW